DGPLPAIEVVTPNGGETFNLGDAVSLTWNESGFDPGDQIQITLYDGVVGAILNGSDPDQTAGFYAGSYTWVADQSGSNLTFIVDNTTKGVSDVSDATFTVNADAVAPSVSFVDPFPTTVGDFDAGTETFELYIEFDEDMNQTVDPVISFPNEDPTATLGFSSGTWDSPTTYTAFFDVADNDLDLYNIDVEVSSAQDLAGNTMNTFTGVDAFSINMGLVADFSDVNPSTGSFELGGNVTITYTGVNFDPGDNIEIRFATNAFFDGETGWSYSEPVAPDITGTYSTLGESVNWVADKEGDLFVVIRNTTKSLLGEASGTFNVADSNKTVEDFNTYSGSSPSNFTLDQTFTENATATFGTGDFDLSGGSVVATAVGRSSSNAVVLAPLGGTITTYEVIGATRFGFYPKSQTSFSSYDVQFSTDGTTFNTIDTQVDTAPPFYLGGSAGEYVYNFAPDSTGFIRIVNNESTETLTIDDFFVSLPPPDVTPPTLTSVSIGMDPTGNVNFARTSDVIDIAITASEPITNITANLFSGGSPVTNSGPNISGGPTSWNIRYAPTGTDTEGAYTFTIDFEDLAGNPGTTVTSVTDGSFVSLDKTEPVITGTAISADNSTLTVDFDEDIYSDSDGLTAVTLTNFTVSSALGVATVSGASINVISGTHVEIGLSITGDANGEEVVTVETDGNVYNGAGLNMLPGQSNNTVNLNDNTAPLLSGLSVTGISDNGVDLDINMNEEGTLYYVVTESASPPSAEQIKLGQDENSDAAARSDNFNIVASNTYNFGIGSLNPSTTYHIYWVAEDAALNESNVVTTSFTTEDPPVSLTYQTNAVPNIPLAAGTSDNLIYQVQLDVSGGTATMVGMFFTPDATTTYQESDFTQFNFYESVGVDDFSSATLIGSNPFFNGDPQLPDGSIGILFSSVYTDETVYWYVTADVAAGATIGNTFGLEAPAIGQNFGIQESSNDTDGGLAASSTFTIDAAAVPPIISGLTIVPSTTEIDVDISVDINSTL
ncbi:MAG: hypothetical protein HRT61_20010, partial [Ekhidna sp.]|nr:hypothetical protein [Ekhidna sp.]